ncbi:TolC family protein [Thiohalorhabdus denitrificans]|uniref:TolC family protein n=1 Tax=Thiohalorhabdus denitrificans TaxID=381306 RepID=UPI0009433231|nr:TolC family protein [Thiohalorhabdus denitrificans]
MGLLLLAGLGPSTAAVGAGSALTIERALSLSEEYAPLQRELQAEVELAESRALEASLWPNPRLNLSQERFSADGSETTQRFYSLSQEFDLSGQRGLRTRAARARAEGVRRGNTWTRLEHRARVRERFFVVLAQRRRVAALQESLERLDRVAGIVAERRRAGAASGYDQRRLEREGAALRAQLRQARAERARAWSALRALLPESASLPEKVAGTLRPGEVASLARYREALNRRADLRRLQAEARAAGLSRRAANRAWIPDPTVGLGYTTVDQPGAEGGGPLLELAFPMPVFDRGQAQAAAASARQTRAEARYRRLLEQARARVGGLWRQTRELDEATTEFRQQALAKSREVTEIAETAYRAGELGILELLDAYRGQLDARLRALEMARAARASWIDLVRTAGSRP